MRYANVNGNQLHKLVRPMALASVVIVIGCVSGQSNAQTGPVMDYTMAGTRTDFGLFTISDEFTSSSRLLNALAYGDDSSENDQRVSTWDLAGTPLMSTTVLGSDPSQGHNQWQAVPGYTIPVGTYPIWDEFLGNGGLSRAKAQGVATLPQYRCGTSLSLASPDNALPTAPPLATTNRTDTMATTTSNADTSRSAEFSPYQEKQIATTMRSWDPYPSERADYTSIQRVVNSILTIPSVLTISPLQLSDGAAPAIASPATTGQFPDWMMVIKIR